MHAKTRRRISRQDAKSLEIGKPGASGREEPKALSMRWAAQQASRLPIVRDGLSSVGSRFSATLCANQEHGPANNRNLAASLIQNFASWREIRPICALASHPLPALSAMTALSAFAALTP
jgi:hypothetical protein